MSPSSVDLPSSTLSADDAAARSSGPASGALASRAGADRWLLWIVVSGALVRLLIFVLLHGAELYADERQYQDIAVNLVHGRGFALDGRLTSWRPPLYSVGLAGLYAASETTNPDLARAFQALLSLGTVVLVYLLGRRVFGVGVARGAAAVMAFYPPLLFYNNYLLTEVLFIFTVTLTAWTFVEYLASGRLRVLIASGVALGLATLTRDIAWPTVAIMGALVVYRRRREWRGMLGHVALLVTVLVLMLAPWVMRNTRLQGTFTLISTNGGLVLLAGNYEHTPPDHPWRAHALPSELKWRRLFPDDISEGVRQKLAVRRALEYIKERPGLFVRTSIIRAANVWGLERNVVAAFLSGVHGKVSRVTVLGLAGIIFTAEVLTLLLGFAGLCFAMAGDDKGRAYHLYFAGLVLYTTLAHAPVSGHPRYHLPLIPLFTIYAVYAWTIRRELWVARRSVAFKAATACAVLLAAGWVREVFFVEFGRFFQALKAF